MLRINPLLFAARLLAVSAVILVGVACGDGSTYGMAPGYVEPEPVPDAGPPPPPPDAGQRDAGPQPDGGDGCTTEYRDLTPEEDFALFEEHGFADAFSCASCHATGEPTARKQAWGTSDTSADGWYLAVTTLLAQSDQAAAAPDQTSLYKAFSADTATLASLHPDTPAMKAAVVDWVGERRTPIEETVCVDAGPIVDEPDCPPALPSEAESEAEFIDVGLPNALGTCVSCHTGRDPDALGQNWGTTAPAGDVTAADWHEAFWVLAEREPEGTAIEATSMYTHFDGSKALHPENTAGTTGTSSWMTYIRSPQVPETCE